MSDIFRERRLDQRRIILIAIATPILAFGLWAAVRLATDLKSDASTRWSDYLILLLPGLFVGFGGGLLKAAVRPAQIIRQQKSMPFWSRTLLWGCACTILAALSKTTGQGVLITIIGGFIATVLVTGVALIFSHDTK